MYLTKPGMILKMKSFTTPTCFFRNTEKCSLDHISIYFTIPNSLYRICCHRVAFHENSDSLVFDFYECLVISRRKLNFFKYYSNIFTITTNVWVAVDIFYSLPGNWKCLRSCLKYVFCSKTMNYFNNCMLFWIESLVEYSFWII